jgi:arylsulfatase A-like enzyme
MSIVNGISRIGFMKGGKSALWKDEEMADVITAKAIGFIEKSKDKPFFLYFATQDVHVPRVPHPRFAGTSGMGPRGDALIEFDWSVGEVIKKIKNLGLEKNTIFILSSDNGPVVDDGYKDQAVELLGNHKPAGEFRGGKYSSFEGGTRVPGILSWSGTVKPGVSDKLLCQIDMIATFAEMLKVNVPAGAAPDSENHLNAWLNKGGKGRDYLVLQNVNNNLSIEDGNWKYIAPGKGVSYTASTKTETGNLAQEQLYNLSSDKGEKVNVAGQHPEIAERMRTKLAFVKSAK